MKVSVQANYCFEGPLPLGAASVSHSPRGIRLKTSPLSNRMAEPMACKGWSPRGGASTHRFEASLAPTSYLAQAATPWDELVVNPLDNQHEHDEGRETCDATDSDAAESAVPDWRPAGITRFRSWRLSTCVFLVFATNMSFIYSLVSPSERAALESLFNSTRGAGWLRQDNWLHGDPCEQRWYGVACNADNTEVM